jgi:pyridoxamine 5'-phosphate oxidase family protein
MVSPTMSGTFTDAEIEYLNSQPLGRIATVDAEGRPHVVPVGIWYDREADAVVVGGTGGMEESKKFRDASRRPDVAFVVDDLASVDPWSPRGIEIRGRAETHTEGGEAVGERVGASFKFDRAWIRIRPRRILSWGIDNGSFERSARDVG